MLIMEKKAIINSNVIGKAYLIRKNVLFTFWVLFEHRQLVFVKYFVRKIQSSKNMEIEFLEKIGYKTVQEWTNKFNGCGDPIKNEGLIKRKSRKRIINNL